MSQANINKPSDYLDWSARRFGELAVWTYDHRWLVLIASLLVLVGAGFLASKVRFNNSLEMFFHEQDPSYQYYQKYREDFLSDEIAYILYRLPNREHGPFDKQAVEKIIKLTAALEQEVPFAREATSLANAEFMEADDDFIEVHEMMVDYPMSEKELLRLRDIVLSKPIYRNNIIDPKVVHGAIILQMNKTMADSLDDIRLDPEGGDGLANLYPQVSHAVIKEILAQPEYADIEFYYSGDVPMNALYNENTTQDATNTTALTYLIIATLGFVFFRMRLLGILGPLLVVTLATICTMALIYLLGWEVNMLFAMTPTLITAIGVAQSVHLLSEFQIARAAGAPRREALREAMTLVGNPCMLAALTTAAGFLAMMVSDMVAIAEWAVYGAVGVLMSFFLTITLLLCLLSFGKDEIGGKSRSLVIGTQWIAAMLAWINGFVQRRAKAIALVSGLLLLLAAAGLARLTVDFNFLHDFHAEDPWRVQTEYIEDTMGGMLSLVYVFDAHEEDGVKDPEVLKKLEALQKEADKYPAVKKSLSVIDILKDINQTFHGDDPAFYKIPESRELVSQYLLMYELSGGDELDEYVTPDYSRAVVQLRVDMGVTENVRKLIVHLQKFEQNQQGDGLEVQPSGVGMLWVIMAEYISSSQLKGYALAFGVITLLMCVIFRSVKVGLLAMVPNLVPVLLVLGYMGWIGTSLDYIRLLLATIAIGIAVDDTVHLINRMRYEFLRCGNYRLALERSLKGVGQALVITSVILTCGFLALLISKMAVMASFSILLAVTIMSALLADLFLMPALMLLLKPFGAEFDTQPEQPKAQFQPA